MGFYLTWPFKCQKQNDIDVYEFKGKLIADKTKLACVNKIKCGEDFYINNDTQIIRIEHTTAYKVHSERYEWDRIGLFYIKRERCKDCQIINRVHCLQMEEIEKLQKIAQKEEFKQELKAAKQYLNNYLKTYKKESK